MSFLTTRDSNLEDNDDPWRKLYRANRHQISFNPFYYDNFGKLNVDIGVALDEKPTQRLKFDKDIESRTVQVQLIGYSQYVIGLMLFLVMFTIFITLVSRSRIIRTVNPSFQFSQDTKTIRYSLGRTQMAIWFFLVGASYIIIWAATGDINSISGSELVLLGISSTTALGTTLIEENITPEKRAEREKYIDDINADILKIKSNPTLSTEDKIKLANNESALDSLEGRSRGFFMDLISDHSGVTMHRFQILGWTLVLGLVYIVQVIQTLTPPSFDTITLGLMGISAGYLPWI